MWHNGKVNLMAPTGLGAGVDFDDHFIQMPFIAPAQLRSADAAGDGLTEFVGPTAHRFVAHLDPARGEHIFDHAEAQGKSIVEPHRQGNDVTGETMAVVRHLRFDGRSGLDMTHNQNFAAQGRCSQLRLTIPTFSLARSEALSSRLRSSRQKDMTMKPTVAIVGAGLGGLTFARVLCTRGIAATVYEAETSATARSQGGMLDIHKHNGQVALRAAELFDTFETLIHVGGEASRILDNQGRVLMDEPDDGSGNRPEVPRGELRRMLLASLPTGTVRWGHKFKAASSLGQGRHKLTFVDGDEVTCDLLVGADGAWSKVRPLVSDAKPAYAGTIFIETFLRDSDNRHKAAAKIVGAGAMYALTPGKGITAHREPNGVLHAYVALAKPADWTSQINFSDPMAAAERIAQEFEGWAPALRALITECDTGPVPRAIHALPDNHRWARTPGVTLVGDAAHLMMPSGEGANLAMYDGAELARLISDHPDDTEIALATYEAELFARCMTEAAGAHEVFDACYGKDAPQSLLDFFRRHQPA